MRNSKLKTQNSKLLIIIGLILAVGILWLLYLYIFAWHDAPYLAQMVGG